MEQLRRYIYETIGNHFLGHMRTRPSYDHHSACLRRNVVRHVCINRDRAIVPDRNGDRCVSLQTGHIGKFQQKI